MKKKIAGLLVLTMLLSMGSMTAFAGTSKSASTGGNSGSQTSTTDKKEDTTDKKNNTNVASGTQATGTQAADITGTDSKKISETVNTVYASEIEAQVAAGKKEIVLPSVQNKKDVVVTVSKDVLAKAKDKKIVVPVASNCGMQFEFTNYSGADFVTNFTEGKEAVKDVTAKIAASASKDVNFYPIDFAMSGSFSGVQIKIDAVSIKDGVATGDTIYFYYYNEEKGAFKLEASAKVDENGQVELPLTHCSKYVAVDKELDASIVYSDAPAAAAATTKTGDTAPILALLICVAAGASLMLAAYARKNRA